LDNRDRVGTPDRKKRRKVCQVEPRVFWTNFAYLVLAGLFNLLTVRECLHFWKSRPGNLLLLTVGAEILFVCAVSLLGFLELSSIGIFPLLVLLVVSAGASLGIIMLFWIEDHYKSKM
jgi:hypothetical protein